MGNFVTCSGATSSGGDGFASDAITPSPILFIGGMGAVNLVADLNRTETRHFYCWKTAKAMKIWLDWTSLAPGATDCWLDNMSLHWRKTTSTSAEYEQIDAELGIHVYPEDDAKPPGTTDFNDGLYKVLWDALVENAESMSKGKPYSYSRANFHQFGNLFYDFRKGPTEWAKDGTFAKTKKNIETYADALNKGKPAVIVTLSEGGTFFHWFMRFISEMGDAGKEWKSRYIAHWVSLSGTFGGTPELLRAAIYPDSIDDYHMNQILPWITKTEFRDMSATLVATFTGMPNSYFKNEDDEILVRSTSGNYSLSNLTLAFKDSGLIPQISIFDQQKQHAFENQPSPGVPVSCFYGVNKDTLSTTDYMNGWNRPATKYWYENGDSVVPRRSLELCKRWPETVEAEGFPGLGHGDTLRDKNVMERWVKVLEKVNGDGEASAARTSKASIENIAALDNAVGNEIYV
jgi:hypothetical protein